MEQRMCSETLEFKPQTPGNNPEESIRPSEHGESLKSRSILKFITVFTRARHWSLLCQMKSPLKHWLFPYCVLRPSRQIAATCGSYNTQVFLRSHLCFSCIYKNVWLKFQLQKSNVLFTLKVEIVCFFETLAPICQTTRRHIPLVIFLCVLRSKPTANTHSSHWPQS
jgi:hypothetical protein